MGGAANAVALIALAGITLARKTRRLIWFTGAAAALNIGVNLIVIPRWGMVGAAFATAIAYALLFALYYLSAQRVYPTPYKPGRVLRVALLVMLAGRGRRHSDRTCTFGVALKTATLAAFLVGVWAFRVIEPSEFAQCCGQWCASASARSKADQSGAARAGWVSGSPAQTWRIRLSQTAPTAS